ncbi:retrovirus-related pol polyprotein from transposon TNT 1-94 [Tanacetum coccineum]
MLVGSLAGSAANVPDEELEMAVVGPVANNVVGAEVLWVEGPYSPKSVPDFAPCDEACSSETTTEGYMENFKNVSEDVRNLLQAEVKAVHIILTWIDNDIYSTFDASANFLVMWKAIERLKQGESINVQDLETNLYWEFGKFTSQDGESLESYYSRMATNKVNEIRAEILAHTANPLALVAQQQLVYHPQANPTHYTQNFTTRSQPDATRNRGKVIINSPLATYDQEPVMVAEDETLRANQDNSPRINRGTGYDNQRAVNVAEARHNVGTQVVQQSGIQCYNYKEFRHVARECKKPKWANDATYHNEKMLLCQQEEVRFQLSAKQAEGMTLMRMNLRIKNWKHIIYMSSNREEADQDDNDDLTKERDFLASLIEKLQCEIGDSKNRNNFLESSNKTLVDKLKSEIEDFKNKNKCLESSNNHFKEANTELAKNNQLMFKDLKKFQAKLDRYHDVNYVSNVEIDCEKAKWELISHKMSSEKSFNMDETIPWDNKCKSLKELDIIKHIVQTILNGVECCKYVINKKIWKGHIDPVIQTVIKDNFPPTAAKLRTLLENIHWCLKEEMVVDLKYFNSLEKEVESLQIQLETQRTQFSNEIDRLSREYYYADHMNVILGVYTDLDEVTDLQCDYMEALEKCQSTMKFGNDHIAPILGYGDLVQGNITIKRVYYVEGLIRNLFAVTQFCDVDLEVAFWKSTCYVHDLKGNDLLTGSRSTDLYSITLQDTHSPNPLCLMAIASSSQAWLWHHRLSHLNFDSINLLSKNDIVIGLPKLKFFKDHLFSSCELGKAKQKSFKTKTTPSSKRCGLMRVESINGKKYVLVIVDDYSRYTWTHFLRSKGETPEVLIDFLRLVQRGLHAQVRTVRTDKGTNFLNKTLHAYFAKEGIKHQTSITRTPEENGVIERWNRTLVEVARTMLSATKVLLFSWAEAIATKCFTQNR